ncbi:MAG: CotH kinase family protein [Flavobacteriales bacterium]
MKKLLFLVFFPFTLLSQSVDHWETVVFESEFWKYYVGISEPDSNWRTISYDDSLWQNGQGGFGYGDGDDSTIINPTISLYLRNEFSIIDTSEIGSLVLDIDFDDAFVAYLNDVEIARSNIGIYGDHPAYNQVANTYKEAQMYQGGSPDQFIIDPQLIDTILKQGVNVLSVQIHNQDISSSDLTARVFISLGITSTNLNYSSPHSWFNPPLIFTSSNLPIVMINTNNQNILDSARIICDMGIIDNGFGNLNSINDTFNDYNGKISIEYRGSSSQSFPKKSYGFETQDSLGNNNNVSLLGMPIENDWILYAPYTDKSLMRNFLTFDLGRKMGNYCSRTIYCELVINGDYQGVYILMEKIKRDKNRVDIAALDSDDLNGDSLTGGYIVKIDKFTGSGGSNWQSNFPNLGGGSIFIQYHYPEGPALHPIQKNYIENFVDSFENALSGPNFNDTLIGYSKYIDVNSFIDLYIINELSRNIDGYRLSTYMYKDRDDNAGKLTMGPFWDYNLAFGNANFCNGGLTNGWEVDDGGQGCAWNNPFWFERLLEDSNYVNKLKCRWEYLRANSFHKDSIFNFIDSVVFYLEDASDRNFQKWDILDTYVWPNFYVGNTYQDEIGFLKNWIEFRLVWIDNNLLGNCYGITGCTDPIACNFNQFANYDDGSCIYDSYSYDTLVSNSSISWNGIVLYVSGDYSIILTNSIGCDSITNINFTLDITSSYNYYDFDKRSVVKITDVLGKEVLFKLNKTLFFHFDDGRIEKRIIIK